MALSPAALAELRAELDGIEELRTQMNQKLDARAAAIRSVLEPFGIGQNDLPFSSKMSSTQNVTGAHVPSTVVMGGVSVIPSKYASTGLRAAILGVLKTGPNRAPAVARILEAGGFKNDSSTPLATRVYNDLWRMKEAGVVNGENGVFSLREVA